MLAASTRKALPHPLEQQVLKELALKPGDIYNSRLRDPSWEGGLVVPRL